MGGQLVCALLFRLLMPLILLAAVIVRYNGLSFMYACLLLVALLLQVPTPATMKGHTGKFLIAAFVLSTIAMTAQVVFQITLVGLTADGRPYGHILPNCSVAESVSRQLGFQRLERDDALNVIRVIVPDVAVFIVTLTTFLVCQKLLRPPSQRDESELPLTVQISPTKSRRRRRTAAIIDSVGTLLVTLFLGLSGIVHPSMLSAVYFLVFLGVCTYWSCYHSLGRRFAVLRVVILTYSALHLLALYLYQFPFFQEALPPDSLVARVLGLTGIVAHCTCPCAKPWLMDVHPEAKWTYFVSPGVILLLYIVLAWETRRFLEKKAYEETVATTGGTAETTETSRRYKRRRNSTGSERQSLIGVAQGTVPNYSAIKSDDDTEAAPPGGEEVTTPASTSRERTVTTGSESQPRKRTVLMSLFVFAMRQSYVIALIIMMTWSVTYHSWLTFVLLLAACIIWMTPASRLVCLRVSPVVVFYAECLLCLQYIYGLSLTNKELPVETKSGYKLKELGLIKHDYPFLHLLAQVAYTVVFWLTMRQNMREYDIQSQERAQPGLPLHPVENGDRTPSDVATAKEHIRSADYFEGYDSSSIKEAGQWFWHILSKYWIFVCAGMFLLMALQEVVLYRIIYMVLFLYFAISFQICYGFWRVQLFVFWWVVIVYSMVVLCLIYTYQFDQFPEYWRNGTGLSDQNLRDIGLQTYDTGTLFVKLFTPLSFLIVIILQLNFFHKKFLSMSHINRFKLESISPTVSQVVSPGATHSGEVTTSSAVSAAGIEFTMSDYTTDTDTEGPKVRKIKWTDQFAVWFWKFCKQAYAIADIVSRFIWRLLEIHMFKIAAFTILLCCCLQVSAINVIFVILVTIGLPIPLLYSVMSGLSLIWASICVLTKMIFQLRLIDDSDLRSNCSFTNVSNGIWIGLEKTESISSYVIIYIAIIVILLLEAITKVHQAQYYNKPGVVKPMRGIIFPEIKRLDADKNLPQCIMYLLNYAFYKYGLEICCIMTVITAGVRLDVYSVVYAVLLGIVLILSRRGCYIFWPVYMIILAILLPLQYLSSVGIPPALCWVYPWQDLQPANLPIWLYLPSYTAPPNTHKLMADFFQLLFVCLQWRVFRLENSHVMEQYGGGSNKDIIKDVEMGIKNPMEDFTSCKDSYLDYIKSAVFQHMFWVTLAIVFITGTTRISLFCMGYLVGCFFFLWHGQELLLRPLRNVIRLWGILLGYNFFVIFAKSCIQLVGCVYLSKMYDNNCWVVQLFSIVCLKGGYHPVIDPKGDCNLPKDEAGLAWDAVCFVFLLFQVRIFKSFYFQHVVTELLVQNKLASRGAELVNLNLIRSVEEMKSKEENVLNNIKKKMDRIKAKQAKLQEKAVIEPSDHYIKQPETYHTAIRSGDYYMFEDDTDDEDTEDVLALAGHVDEPSESDKRTALQLINVALDSGTKAALEESEKGAEEEDAGEKTEEKKEEEEEETEEAKKESLGTRIMNTLKLIWAVIGGLLDSAIAFLKGISHEQTEIAKILDAEKEKEKQQLRDMEKHVTSTTTVISEEDSGAVGGESREDPPAMKPVASTSSFKEPSRSNKIPKSPRSLDITSPLTVEVSEEEKDAEEKFTKSTPRIFQLLIALYDSLIAKSELVCYFVMILNQMISASLLTLPYPLCVFLWSMLSVPRPTKTFWITMITYTEAVVVVKYLFQFGFFPWNDKINENPFFPPRIIGIEKKDNYAMLDLVLLIVLFVHRSILKRYGLWKDAVDTNADLKKAEYLEKISSQPNTPTSPAKPIEGTEGGEAEGATGITHSPSEGAISQQSSENGEGSKVKRREPEGPCARAFRPFVHFYRQMTNPRYNAVTDVYAPMFLCDFINFIIIVFGYWAFGPVATSVGNSVANVIEQDRVPVPFLIMLLTQFVLIIIDRALFLRKNVVGKFFFQIFLVVLIHLWMFFGLPAITERNIDAGSFTQNVPAQLWYFVKCIYFGLSAYQIRSGYPTRILGNFLTKNYNYANLFLFKGFLAIPFLLELRALMDWMWTDTTLALTSWLEMEDIYSNIFVLKCWRRAETEYPTPRGTKRKPLVKYGFGGLVLVLIIFIIWFPLVLFSFANTVYESNLPISCSATISLGGYQPIFRMNAQQQFLLQLTEFQYNSLKLEYQNNKTEQPGVGFLSNYEYTDVMLIRLQGNSTAVWGISPPSKENLIATLNSSAVINLIFTVEFTRESKPGKPTDSIVNEFSHRLEVGHPLRQGFAEIISGISNQTVLVDNLFPTFMHLPDSGRPMGVKQLQDWHRQANVSFNLQPPKKSGDRQWWELKQKIWGSDVWIPGPLQTDSDELYIFAFNDRVAPAGLSFLTGYGIIGLYISLVLVIGRFVRLFMSNVSHTIMFTELPYVDKILQLCLDIYMVRESKDFSMEEDMFAKLIFLYRSPETLYKWTKLKVR